ncbi:HAD family hydrolase [Knoellia sp. Soil729]|uniref:HAD family hydrolase n=1 Tax=Knoellia sp. Soil729 TaxID=1736394 RepID=UPI0009EC2CF2|nr:HAD-IA family hydrolase [Knoellia sp. Soil729]
MSAPRWQTIFFDLDGTLANTIPLIVASYQHAFREVRGEEIEDARARAWIGRPLLGALLEEDPERGHDLDRTYREWNLANTSRLIERYDGVPEMLSALTEAGADLHIVTSKRRDTARLALTGVGIDHLIDVTGALEDTARHKPDPEPLLVAAAKVGVDPSTAVYVGDATVDILAARAAGMAGVAVTWGAGERAALEATDPATVVDTVAQLTAYLLGGTGVTDGAAE